MATQKMNNVSTLDQIIPENDCKSARKGRPPRTAINPFSLVGFVVYLNKMARRYKINYESMQLLIILHSLWELKRKGVSKHGLVKFVDWYNSGSVHDQIGQRLLLLQSRGLIEVVGKGRYNCFLYAPTNDALRDMVEMISKLD